MKYALFKKQRVTANPDDLPLPVQKWLEENVTPLSQSSKSDCKIVFVGFADSPKDAARLVRQSPLDRYYLLQGSFSPIQVGIPVLIDGVNLDTMDDEWGSTPTVYKLPTAAEDQAQKS